MLYICIKYKCIVISLACMQGMMFVSSIRLVCIGMPTGKSPSVFGKRTVGACDGLNEFSVAWSHFVAIVYCNDSGSIILFP